MKYVQTNLKNGLRLITTFMPSMRSASIAFLFAVGSRYEADHIAGISHFIEHMLFKGSRNYPSAKLISEAIEGVGGNFNGSTGKEITSYTARVPSEHLPVVLEVMANMIRYPLFEQSEVEKERSVIIEELSATQDDPQEWASLLAEETMWPNLPLGRDDAGTIETVKHLQRQQLLEYLHTYYRPNSLVISIAGKINQQQVIEQVEQLFGDWNAGIIPGWTQCYPPLATPPIRLVNKKTEQTNLCLATLGVNYASQDYYTFLLINALLGDGMSSRLFQTIREEQGLAYDIGSYFNTYYETGNFIVSAGVDPSHAQETITAIVSALQLLCNEPVPNEELERTKAYVRGGFLLGLEGTQQVASWLGSQECLYHQVRDIDEILSHVDAVSASDILRVARTCFAPEWRRLAIIGPHSAQRIQVLEKLLAGV
jgi:predicted Zn-dependent peptidase